MPGGHIPTGRPRKLAVGSGDAAGGDPARQTVVNETTIELAGSMKV